MRVEWIGGVEPSDTIETVIAKLDKMRVKYISINNKRTIMYQGICGAHFGEFLVNASYPQNHRVSSVIFKVYSDSLDWLQAYFNTDLEKYTEKYGYPVTHDTNINTVTFDTPEMKFLMVAQWQIDEDFFEIAVGWDKKNSKYRYSLIVSNKMKVI